MKIQAAHFILYVSDQQRSAAFYRKALNQEPRLDIPGMTEFDLSAGVVLGLMPLAGIRRLLRLPEASEPHSSLPAELYLHVPDPFACHQRAMQAGAVELSPLAPRDWGDLAAYCQDPDGYVLAFARSLDESQNLTSS